MFARYSIKNLPPELAAQVRVSKLLGIAFGFSLLGVAFVFSLTYIANLGSLMAFILGLRASRLINKSPYRLFGGFLLWWSLVVGGIGTLMLPLTSVMILNSWP
jgi:hypothetical protein